MPYFGYSRKERKTKLRNPITGRLVFGVIQIAGADSCVLVELQTTTIEGFFNIPTNHLETAKLLANAYIKYKTKSKLACLVSLTLLLLRFIQITENNLPPIWQWFLQMLVRLEEPVILVDIYNKPISPLLKSGAQGQTKQKFYP